jgi:hypothetical protein
MRTRFVWTTATAAALAVGLTANAQTPPPPSQPDRPRDTMAQPDDRQKEMTFTGCVQSADAKTSPGAAGSTPPSTSGSARSGSDDAKYILTSASMGSGSSATGTTGATAGTTGASATYKLKGEEDDLAKFVGQRVEIRGRFEDKMGSSSGTAASPSQPGSTASASADKIVKVSSVKATSGSCS